MKEVPAFVALNWEGQTVRIEHQWVGRDRAFSPLIVFLHEGLGSVSMWKDFPQHLCSALGCRGLVYSRPGYGRSTPRAPAEAWHPNFMHWQARQVLPALLQALGIDTATNPPWLLGHSDGASISLIHAASFPDGVAGAIVLAPHIRVEEKSLRSIEQARRHYLEGDLRQCLARHHDNPDSAFWGWNDIWLHADFRFWTLEPELKSIRCPLLAVQGLNDEYGTLAQIRGIADRARHTELLELTDCGHSPHRDQRDAVTQAIAAFMEKHRHR